MHFDLDQTVALACLAAPSLDVEGKTARRVAAGLRFRKTGEPFPDRGEGAGVGGRIRPRRAADGRLVDIDNLVEKLASVDRLVWRRHFARLVQAARQPLPKRFEHQRGFSAAGDAGHAGQHAEWKINAYVAQVVAGGILDPHKAAFLCLSA